MAYKVQKPCKVCGRMYTPCFDCEQDNKTFRWRTVACSVKCGMEYFKLVEEYRDKTIEEFIKYIMYYYLLNQLNMLNHQSYNAFSS